MKKIEIIKKSIRRFNLWSKKYDTNILQRIIFRPSHRMIINNMKHLMKSKVKILDVACGTGEFVNKIAKSTTNQVEIYGVDSSPGMIKQAIAKNSHISWKVGNVENLPYEDNTFDIITCSHAFHHFQNQQRAVNEMYRIVKPGGTILIADGHKRGLLGWIIFTIVTLQEKNVHHASARQMSHMFMEAGFLRVRHKPFNIIAPTLLTIGKK